MIEFNYNTPYLCLNLRNEPHFYRIGRSEQGAMLVQPYKSELLPLFKTKTEAEASKSADEIFEQYKIYARLGDFPGSDMARKYLQMGFSVARRYANHTSGKKYDKRNGSILPLSNNVKSAAKALCASFFKNRLDKIIFDHNYIEARKIWRRYEEDINQSDIIIPVPTSLQDLLKLSAKSISPIRLCFNV